MRVIASGLTAMAPITAAFYPLLDGVPDELKARDDEHDELVDLLEVGRRQEVVVGLEEGGRLIRSGERGSHCRRNLYSYDDLFAFTIWP